MSANIVSIAQVSKHYQDLAALRNVSLELAPGEVLGLFGHNGAGKTTMMKLILGIIPASKGQVSVFGADPSSKEAWHGRSKIGYLPENVSFYEHLTGAEVLRYFARLKSVNKKQVLSLLEQVGLVHAMHRPVKTYSKGMRQRLGLAQAFLGEPKLLLLDEPTVGLDPTATREFYQSVDNLKSTGASIILCSHVLPGVEQHIDRAMILSGGEALTIGTLAELRAQAELPEIIQAQGIEALLTQDPLLAPYYIGDAKLAVDEANKMKVIKQLMTYPQLSDLKIEHASLEQLYQHYLAQGHQPTTTVKAVESNETIVTGVAV